MLLVEHIDSGRLREAALLAIDVEMRAHTLDEFESPEQQVCAIAMLAGTAVIACRASAFIFFSQVNYANSIVRA